MTMLPPDWEYKVFEVKDRHILLDVNSSQFRFISPATARLLPRALKSDDLAGLTDLDPAEEERARVEIGDIREQGFATARDMLIDQRVVEANPRMKVLFLNVVHECNLRCRYCFAGEGSYRGPSEIMTDEVARKAVDLLIADSNEDKVLIRFFGGEPLLNYPLIVNTVDYAKRQANKANKTVSFSIFTNATPVTEEIARFFKDNNFELLVSLDGPPATNDRMRVNVDGSGSHDNAVRGIRLLQAIVGLRHIGCRVVITPEDLDLRGIVDHITSLDIIKIMFGRVWDTGVEDYAFTRPDIDRFKQALSDLADLYLESALAGKVRYLGLTPIGGFVFRQFDSFNKDVYHCLTGRKVFIVTPKGDIWPCFHFIGREEYLAGHVDTGIDERVRQLFIDNHSDKRPSCRNCWARYLCGGGCPANHLAVNDTIGKVRPEQCEIDQHTIRESMYVYLSIKEHGPRLLNTLRTIGGMKDGFHSDKGFVENLETLYHLDGDGP